MDERKPTYKELMEEHTNILENTKSSDTLFSMVSCILVITGFVVIQSLAELGLWTLLQGVNATPAWAKFCISLEHMVALIIAVYIAWHFIYVFMTSYGKEINEVIEHWRLTRKSIQDTKEKEKAKEERVREPKQSTP